MCKLDQPCTATLSTTLDPRGPRRRTASACVPDGGRGTAGLMQAAATPDSASTDGRLQRRQRLRGCPWPPRSCPARWPCGYYGIVVVLLCALVKTHRSFGVSRIFAFTVPGIMADSSLPESHFSAIYGGATLAGAATDVAASTVETIGSAVKGFFGRFGGWGSSSKQ